ncbi:MAG: putative T7SS-secreted protein [Sciscionella sp.]
MVAQLGQTSDPKALIPGDPEAIANDLRELVGGIGKTAGIGDDLNGVDPAGWTGHASDAFRREFGAQPPHWFQAADGLADGGNALAGYAEVLTWAQGQAMRAIELHTQAEAASTTAAQQFDARQAQPGADPGAVFTDPGSAGRNEAQAILDHARQQQQGAGDQAAHRLSIASGETPGNVKHGKGGSPHWGDDQSSGMLDGVIGDTLKGFGVHVPTATASASAGVSVLSGAAGDNFQAGPLSGAYAASGSVLGADAGAHASAGLLGVSAGANADAYLAKGSVDGALALGKHTNLTGHAEGEIGATAAAGASVGPTGVQAHAGAFAGAKVSGDVGADVGGVHAGVHGEAWAGAGVDANAQLGMGNDGKFHIGASLGVGLGIGGKLGYSVAIDPAEVAHTVHDVAGDVGHVADEVGHGISGAASTLTGGLL